MRRVGIPQTGLTPPHVACARPKSGVLWSVVCVSPFDLLVNFHKLIWCGVHRCFAGAIQSSLHGVDFHCSEDLVSPSGSFFVLFIVVFRIINFFRFFLRGMGRVHAVIFFELSVLLVVDFFRGLYFLRNSAGVFS